MMAAWEENVRRVIPYTPGEQPKERDIVKLNTNENPYPPSPMVLEAVSAVDVDGYRKYPAPDAGSLVSAIAKNYGVEEENVFVGVGSDDVLAMSFLTFFDSDKKLLFPDVTYSFYDVWADLFNIKYETVPLDDDFRIRAEDYFCDNGGIIFPNPNAPTGVAMAVPEIERIVKNNPDSVVIVDEAYVDFGCESALPLTKKYDNVLVVQTFSKSRSMAGASIGFALGDAKLIKYLNDVKFSFNSYTMSATALAAGVAAVSDREYFEDTVSKIIATREKYKKELKRLGFSFPDSRSNFIFARHDKKHARDIFEFLKKNGIFVRYFDKPRIDEYIRITVGTDAQMERLINTLEGFL